MSRNLKRLRKITEKNTEIKCNKTDQQCLVCMEIIEDGKSGSIDCGHSQFCLCCINNWSSITNKCPLCSLRFYHIKNTQTGEISTVYEKDQSSDSFFEEHYRGIRCQVCDSPEHGDVMLLCDTCDQGYHTTCIGLLHVPNLEEWFCEGCIRRKPVDRRVKQMKEMERCAEKEEAEKVEEEEVIEKKRKLRSCREVRINAMKLRRSPRVRKCVNE